MKNPNIVFILADDLGYGDVASYNSESKVPTPNLDKLASQGLSFTDAHAPAAVCSPSRFSVLTGCMNFRNSIQGVFTGAGGPCMIDDSRLTVPGMLREKGYTTACFGKWHIGLTFKDHDGNPICESGMEAARRVDFSRPIIDAPIHRGFDHFFGTACCGGTDHLYCYIDGDRIPVPPVGMLNKTQLPDHAYSVDNRDGLVAPDYDIESLDQLFLEKSQNFIQEHVKNSPDKPFFLYHATNAVHLPSFANKAYQGATDAGPHGDFIFEFDAIVGGLMETLEIEGISDNTLFMVSSDNGPEDLSVYHMRHDHEHDGARPWRGYKRLSFEGGHRIPFIARWPEKIAADTKTEQTVSLCDLMATCAALVEYDLPDNSAEDSYNLLPVLIGEQDPSHPIRQHTFQQSSRNRLSLRKGPWKYLDHQAENANGRMAEYALPEKAKDAPAQLYNLSDDPGETTNLYFEHPDMVEELRNQLYVYRDSGRSRP